MMPTTSSRRAPTGAIAVALGLAGAVGLHFAGEPEPPPATMASDACAAPVLAL